LGPKIFEVAVRGPVLSIKHLETYQVAISYPLLLPSTILGAIAFGIAQIGGHNNAEECLRKTRKLIKKARDSAANVTKFPIILRRNRKILEEKRMPENIDQINEVRDALIREHQYSYEHKILIVPNNNMDHNELKELENALWLIERLGDSESLASTISVREEEAQETDEDKVNVITAYKPGLMGNFTIMKALDENSEIKGFAFPIISQRNMFEAGYIKIGDRDYRTKSFVFPMGDDW